MRKIVGVFLLVIGLTAPASGLMAQVLIDDDVPERLVKACPELDTDPELVSLLEKSDLLAKNIQTGNPKADAAAQCIYYPAMIRMLERTIAVYKSCLPNTEPLINSWMNVSANGIQGFRSAMVRLGCQ